MDQTLARLFPPRLRRNSGNFCPLLRGQAFGPCGPALYAPCLTPGHGSRTLSLFLWRWFPVFDLASSNVADQLGELKGIARTFEALGGHARIMAWIRAASNRQECWISN
jgi:hypothetical protein